MVDTRAVEGEKVDLRFTVLGGTIGVSEAGHPVALGGAQQRRVLAAFLAEAGVVVSADRLVEAVWPDGSAPEGARRTAMSYVSRLRAAIGAEHLVTRDNGYVLELDGATYDAAEFEARLAEARQLVGEEAVLAYDAALALWSGRAFGDDGSEWWLRPVAARLEELRLLAEEERAERLIECGRHAEAVVDLDRLVTEQPLRERFVDLLMRALYLAGRQAEALRAFQRFRDYLAEETGPAPAGCAGRPGAAHHGGRPVAGSDGDRGRARLRAGRGHRRGGVRQRVPGRAAHRGTRGGGQGDPPRVGRRPPLRPALRSRGPVGGPHRAPPRRAPLRLLAASRRGVPGVPPAAGRLAGGAGGRGGRRSRRGLPPGRRGRWRARRRPTPWAWSTGT